MKHIQDSFPVTEEEYSMLDDKFGELCEYQAWQLIKKNTRNNHTDSQEDIAQDMRIALLRAASYYKRQCYIEDCLDLCKKSAKDEVIKSVVKQLSNLWKNKTRHGANKQKFGPHQEKMLDKLVKSLVPTKQRPNRKAPLRMDTKFITYCKAITWNAQKSLGKKITREKSIRTGMVSLSEFDYLGGKG
jgi:hypothetical protein